MKTTIDIEQMAIELIQRENATDWRYEIGKPTHRDGSIWTILVRWISPDGDPLDGPGIIEIDEVSGEAWFVETC